MSNKQLKKRLRKVRSLRDIELEKQRLRYDSLKAGQKALTDFEDAREAVSSGRVFKYLFRYATFQLFGSRHYFFRAFFEGFKYFFRGRFRKRRNNHKPTQ